MIQSEASLQRQVVRFLDLALPDDVLYCASLSGVYLTPATRAKASQQGLRKGWPDLQFLIRGRTYFVELKSDTGRLTPEQQFFLSLAEKGSVVICRSLEDVVEALEGWDVKLRASVT